jgi:peptidoglycan/xylan/chitin deacetylase (PgdA/CDA1 family)
MRSAKPARCVLTFHRVVDVHERDHDISWPSFFRVLDMIEDEVTTELRLGQDSGRSVVLTVDDGSADHAEVGRALAERHLPGIFFVPAGLLGSEGFLTEDQMRELHAQGHMIGSHGFHNVRFEDLAPAELRQEVRGSKQRLQEVLGATVTYLAPPGGSEHPLLAQELEESGYSAARSVRWGIHRSEADRWRIPCVPVTELTIARGWVERVLADWSLPLAMRAVWGAKELFPANVRSVVRAWSHRGARR